MARNLVVYPIETKNLDIDIKWLNVKIMVKLSLGLRPLPRCIKHLFHGEISKLLKILNNKIKWLISVYDIIDQFSSRYLYNRQKSPQICVYFNRYFDRLLSDET